MSEEAGHYGIGLEEFVRRGQAAQKASDHVLLMHRIKKCLHRWASRYAASPHAKAHVKETQLIEQEIDEWLLNQ